MSIKYYVWLKSLKSYTFFTTSYFCFCLVYSTECNVIINIIDLNNEVPIFEKNDVSSDAPLIVFYLSSSIVSALMDCACSPWSSMGDTVFQN